MTSPTSDQEAGGSVRQAELTKSDIARGSCLYLTAEDLEALGVDTDDADAIRYVVDEESARLEIKGVSDGDAE